MSNNKKKTTTGESGKEAIVLVAAVILVMVGLIGFLWYNQRKPSEIAGVRLTVYETGMAATEAIKNEIVLKDASETITDAENEDVQAIIDFQTFLSNQQLTLNDEENTFISAVASVITAQGSQAQMILLDDTFKADTTGQFESLGNLEDMPAIIDIYEEVWKAGVAAVESKNLDAMDEFLTTDEWETKLKPYDTLLTNIIELLNSEYTATDSLDDGLNQSTTEGVTITPVE